MWALTGLERLRQRQRFVQPESAKQHIEELFAMTSPISVFVNAKCELGPEKWIETQTLFSAWVKWCDETGYEKSGNLQVFGRNLRAALPQIQIKQRRRGSDDLSRDKIDPSRDKIDRIRVYEGIGLSIL